MKEHRFRDNGKNGDCWICRQRESAPHLPPLGDDQRVDLLELKRMSPEILNAIDFANAEQSPPGFWDDEYDMLSRALPALVRLVRAALAMHETDNEEFNQAREAFK